MTRRSGTVDASYCPRKKTGEATGMDREGPASTLDVYRSVVGTLHRLLESACFLPPALAERIAADLSGGRLPLPSRLLAEDEALSRELDALPAVLSADEPCILKALARRGDVALCDIERLAGAAARALADALTEVYGLKLDHAHYLAACAREESVMRAMEQAPRERVESYVEDLARRGALTGDRILNFARRGDSPLFHAGIGHCTGMAAEMVEAFLSDGGGRALARILNAADFVRSLRNAIRAAYEEATAGSGRD